MENEYIEIDGEIIFDINKVKKKFEEVEKICNELS